MNMHFYGPTNIPAIDSNGNKDIEHYKKGFTFYTSDDNPGVVQVSQDLRAGEITMSELAQAALMHEGLAERIYTEDDPSPVFVTDQDGKPLQVSMYAIQAYVADKTRELAISRIEAMTDEHVMKDARMRLLMGEFTWEAVIA